MDFRRQAQVCARLAEDCTDRRLAERKPEPTVRVLAAPCLVAPETEGFDTRDLRRRRCCWRSWRREAQVLVSDVDAATAVRAPRVCYCHTVLSVL
jgi:hypothetical protein